MLYRVLPLGIDASPFGVSLLIIIPHFPIFFCILPIIAHFKVLLFFITMASVLLREPI